MRLLTNTPTVTRLLTVALALSLCATVSLARDTPLEFSAQYILQFNGSDAGTVALNVKKTQDGQFKLTSITKATGVMALIGDGDITETSLFEQHDGQLRPLSYQYNDNKKHVDLLFDWVNLRVTNQTKKDPWQQTISTGVLDKALMQITLMQDLQSAHGSLAYRVADSGKLRTYTYTQLGKERIKLGDTAYNTLKLVRQKDKKKDRLYYWCAEELNMLPVMMTRKKSFGTFKMILTKAHFPGE